MGDVEGITMYDDLGETASAGVRKQIAQKDYNEKLLHIWNKITRETASEGKK
jgi:hypothetical protein